MSNIIHQQIQISKAYSHNMCTPILVENERPFSLTLYIRYSYHNIMEIMCKAPLTFTNNLVSGLDMVTYSNWSPNFEWLVWG